MPKNDGELRIGLLWHSASSGNLGVGALTLANMAIARQVAQQQGLTPRFTILGMRDGIATYVPPSEAEVFVIDGKSLLSPRGCWAKIREQDCILDIGGGDSFADIYSDKRFAFLWSTKMMAALGDRPLMFSPQTIGPFSRQPHTALAALALRKAAVVMVRDEPSLEAARKLAPKARTLLSADVAFALPFEDRSAGRGGAKPRVGVNVSGLLFNEDERGENRFGLQVRYADLMRRLIRRLSEQGAEVHLVTHVNDPGGWDDDGAVADRLAGEFPGVVRVRSFSSPIEAKSYISSLDFLVSSRMHACIAALSSGTPVVPIAYSRKFRGVFGLLGYKHLIDVGGMDDDSALDFILDRLGRRDELARDCRESLRKVEAHLDAYRSELAAFFRSAIDRR